MIIKTKKDLSRVLQSIARLKARQTALGIRLELMNGAVLRYFKRKHRTKFTEKDGTTWKQMQGSTAVYDDQAFKTLLSKKGIDPETVYKSRIVIERDDAVVTQLLKENKITIDEWKKVAKIKYFSPYLRRYESRQSKGGSNGTDTGGGLSADQAFSRVRNANKTR